MIFDHQLKPKFSEKDNTITLVLDKEPHTAGIDPTHLLIDRIREDNMIDLTFVK